MGWNLVRHAFSMVFGNLNDALKASAVPFGILIAVVLIFIWTNLGGFVGLEALATSPEAAGQMLSQNAGTFVLSGIVMIALYVFVFSWVAVTWHRFILLEEYPDTVPAVADRPIMAYIGKSIILGLILIAIGIPIFFVAGALIALFVDPATIAAGGFSLPTLIIGIAAGAAMMWFWFRFAVVLPGTAIGKSMTLGEGWAATARIAGPIFVAVLIMIAINFVVGELVGAVFGATGALSAIVQIIVQWISLMVGASMLTTLYGHLVEGRDLT